MFSVIWTRAVQEHHGCLYFRTALVTLCVIWWKLEPTNSGASVLPVVADGGNLDMIRLMVELRRC